MKKCGIASFAVNTLNSRKEILLSVLDPSGDGNAQRTSLVLAYEEAGEYEWLLDDFSRMSLKRINICRNQIYFLFTNGEYAEYKKKKSGKMGLYCPCFEKIPCIDETGSQDTGASVTPETVAEKTVSPPFMQTAMPEVPASPY